MALSSSMILPNVKLSCNKNVEGEFDNKLLRKDFRKILSHLAYPRPKIYRKLDRSSTAHVLTSTNDFPKPEGDGESSKLRRVSALLKGLIR
jgi:hypothetical protein